MWCVCVPVWDCLAVWLNGWVGNLQAMCVFVSAYGSNVHKLCYWYGQIKLNYFYNWFFILFWFSGFFYSSTSIRPSTVLQCQTLHFHKIFNKQTKITRLKILGVWKIVNSVGFIEIVWAREFYISTLAVFSR